MVEKVAINFGVEIMKRLPKDGKVYTQLDIKLGEDEKGVIKQAREIIQNYAELGVPPSNVVLKVPG